MDVVQLALWTFFFEESCSDIKEKKSLTLLKETLKSKLRLKHFNLYEGVMKLIAAIRFWSWQTVIVVRQEPLEGALSTESLHP